MPIKGEAKVHCRRFVFTAPDQVATFNRLAPKVRRDSPAGRRRQRRLLIFAATEPATKGAFIFIRPFKSVGQVLDMKQMVVKGLPNGAIVYGDTFVAERGTGELVCGWTIRCRPRSRCRARRSAVRAAAVSDDFK